MKNKKWAGIISLAILVPILLYVAGIIAQFIININMWKAAGTAIPVFSLRSENGFGVGEFNDLKLLVDWAAATGQKVIQLLPVNDTTMTWTWRDSYPYNACSSFALHPQFIHLPSAGVVEDDEYYRLQKELNSLPELIRLIRIPILSFQFKFRITKQLSFLGTE